VSIILELPGKTARRSAGCRFCRARHRAVPSQEIEISGARPSRAARTSRSGSVALRSAREHCERADLLRFPPAARDAEIRDHCRDVAGDQVRSSRPGLLR